jgi:hypothetical protein
MNKIIQRIVLTLAIVFLLIGIYNQIQFNSAINEFEQLNEQYKAAVQSK